MKLNNVHDFTGSSIYRIDTHTMRSTNGLLYIGYYSDWRRTALDCLGILISETTQSSHELLLETIAIFSVIDN